MASWFKDIPDFNIDTPNVWGQDKLIWDFKKVWQDPKQVKDFMRKKWKDKSAGEVKGKTNPIIWFTKDSDDFLNMIGNDYLSELEPTSRKETIENLNDLFIKARDNYYDKKGQVPVKQSPDKAIDKNRNKTVYYIPFPFGPWVYWTKHEWDEIVYKDKSVRRKSRLDDVIQRIQHQPTKHSESSISDSHRKRGRVSRADTLNLDDRERDRSSNTNSKSDESDSKSGADSNDENV